MRGHNMYFADGRRKRSVNNVNTILMPVATGNKTQAAAERTPEQDNNKRQHCIGLSLLFGSVLMTTMQTEQYVWSW